MVSVAKQHLIAQKFLLSRLAAELPHSGQVRRATPAHKHQQKLQLLS